MDHTAQTPTLYEIITGYKKFEIEDYQRSYAWKKEQIDEFFIDLFDVVETEEKHFFGTLILQEKTSDIGKSAYIVDGQQRLTTIFIVLACLRDHLIELKIDKIPARNVNEMEIDVLNKAWGLLIYSNKFEDLRFESSRFLSTIMRDCVMARPDKQLELPQRDINTTLQLRKSIRIIRSQIAEDLGKFETSLDKVIRINKLLDAIRDQFLVLKVSTNSRNESLDIFLTLNNRGLPLGPSDIVRGEIVSDLCLKVKEEQKQLEIHKKVMDEWNDILEKVGEPETFLRHFLVATDKVKVTKKVIVKQCSDRRFDQDLDKRVQKTQDFWNTVIETAKIYGSIITPKMGGDLQDEIELLEGLGKSHRIFLLGAWPLFSEKDLLDLVRLTRILAYKNVMMGLNAQKLEDFYQDQLTKYRENRDLSKLKKSFTERIDEIHMNTKRYFEVESEMGFAAKAVLHTINRALAPKANQMSVLDKQIHIEHIAPRTKTKSWTEELEVADDIAAGDYEDIISKIGNLTLLDPSINTSISNKSFAEKKAEYKKGVFIITRDISELSTWNVSSIKMRTEYLAYCFDKVWATTRLIEPIEDFETWLKSYADTPQEK